MEPHHPVRCFLCLNGTTMPIHTIMILGLHLPGNSRSEASLPFPDLVPSCNEWLCLWISSTDIWVPARMLSARPESSRSKHPGCFGLPVCQKNPPKRMLFGDSWCLRPPKFDRARVPPWRVRTAEPKRPCVEWSATQAKGHK